MKKMLMYDECNETYTEVIDVQEIKQYIQDLIIKIKNEKVSDNFITLSQGKLGKIIVLGKIIEDLEVEDD